MNILFFGDSNTHGFNHRTEGRYDRDIRFTGRLQREYGDKHYIIEEGLSGRTTVFDDPLTEGLSGLSYISACLRSHAPLDLVVVMLGTNDTKERLGVNAACINLGMQKLIKKIKSEEHVFRDIPKILLISPPIIKDNVIEVYETMGKGCEEKSKQLIPLYEQTAKDLGLYYLRASDYVEFSDIDKMHLEVEGHKRLAEILKEKIDKME